MNNLDFDALLKGFRNWLELWVLLGSHCLKKCFIFLKSKKGDLQGTE